MTSVEEPESSGIQLIVWPWHLRWDGALGPSGSAFSACLCDLWLDVLSHQQFCSGLEVEHALADSSVWSGGKCELDNGSFWARGGGSNKLLLCSGIRMCVCGGGGAVTPGLHSHHGDLKHGILVPWFWGLARRCSLGGLSGVHSLQISGSPWHGTVLLTCGTWWYVHSGYNWQAALGTSLGVVSEISLQIGMATLLAAIAPLF